MNAREVKDLRGLLPHEWSVCAGSASRTSPLGSTRPWRARTLPEKAQATLEGLATRVLAKDPPGRERSGFRISIRRLRARRLAAVMGVASLGGFVRFHDGRAAQEHGCELLGAMVCNQFVSLLQHVQEGNTTCI